MIIKEDEINRIAIDRFVSTSGRYTCLLAERFEPYVGRKGVTMLRQYDFVAMRGGNHVVKIMRLGGDRDRAYIEWEMLREKFTEKPTYEEEPVAQYVAMPFGNHAYTEGEAEMLKLNPIGARAFVRDITPIDEMTQRAHDAGLIAVIEDKNKPRPTMGLVIKVGNDPFIQDMCSPGDVLMFTKHAGSTFMEAGQEYRSIGYNEIIGVRRKEDGLADVGLIEQAAAHDPIH